MSSDKNFYLDGKKIKTPTDFDFEHYKLSKSGRVASGRMVMDIVAKKRKFLFRYSVLSGPQLQAIMDILDSDKAFYELSYPWNGKRETAIVYPGAIKGKRFRTDGIWYWTNVSFDLIEQ